MRLATFNILNGRSSQDGRVDVDRFAAAVKVLDADILGLQEVDSGQERSNHADLTAVAADAMGATDHRFVAALAGTPGTTWTAATGDEQPDTAAYGIALLSRYPVRSWEVARLPALPGRVPHMWHGARWPALVRDEPRVAVSAAVDTPQGELAVATTHLSFIHGWNLVQLRRVVRALEVQPTPHVLMGDLNMTAATARRVSGMSSGVEAPTFPIDRPTTQLDHMLVSGLPDWLRPVDGTAVDLGLSDHRALVADLGPR